MLKTTSCLMQSSGIMQMTFSLWLRTPPKWMKLSLWFMVKRFVCFVYFVYYLYLLFWVANCVFRKQIIELVLVSFSLSMKRLARRFLLSLLQSL